MKRFLLIILALGIILTFAGCDGHAEQEQNPEEAQYAFISNEQKQAWREQLIALLARIEIWNVEEAIPGTFGVGLMDVNCDGVPELLAAYPGGSMGNVYLEIFDLQTEEECIALNVGHYEDFRSIYMCVAEQDGAYLVVTEGVLRNHDIGWLYLYGEFNAQYEHTYPYAKTISEPYLFYDHGNEVDQQSYEARFAQYMQEYNVIASTVVQLICWDTLKATDRAEQNREMADALLQSSQNFIDFSRQ